MEPTVRMIERVMYPLAAFADDCPSQDSGSQSQKPTTPISPWPESYLNPKNRINSLTAVTNPTWSMHGVQADGHRLFVVPSFAVGRPPLRIDMYLAEQYEYDMPSSLVEVLQPAASMRLKSRQVGGTPLCQHLLRALEHWERNSRGFEQQYWSMPFGSMILVESIAADVRQTVLHLAPRYDTEQAWLSVVELRAAWGTGVDLDDSEIIDLGELQLLEQPHEAISIVAIPKRQGRRKLVFKAVLNDLKAMYHELRLLLTMEPHPNIIARPLYVVTKKCRFGGKVGVCGFILEYYSYGTLRDALWRSARCASQANELTIETKFRWAREIIDGVIHINKLCGTYYPGIKHINIVMGPRIEPAGGEDNSPTDINSLSPVLIDFEQRTGRYTWVPPEIYHFSSVEFVANSDRAPREMRSRAARLIGAYDGSWIPDGPQHKFAVRPEGYSSAWNVLSMRECEAAQVYMLGKLLWYIFEEQGSINNGLNLETFREEECDIVFPEFRTTPQPIRKIISTCTRGAPEWSGRLPAVVKLKGKLWARNKLTDVNNPTGTSEDTQNAAREWWVHELQTAESFLMARKREKVLKGALASDKSILSCMKGRPTFGELQQLLQEAENSLVGK
ncbi:hypothetical protein J7T55_013027 [Diaporthe amygdali]|uniref:uncharacterized protein n=1 Tax=Phomopsis amygdali TaxID=1214568 RepID=UPI0022FEF12B|nr:uncharacterized protein J7T55_013027 [Diaporthe amygdali]KAJ0118773.1 hypothetical protein J7T55_013027 [Diaporthe amygdali]